MSFFDCEPSHYTYIVAAAIIRAWFKGIGLFPLRRAGLEEAGRLGLPISRRETLFSTPEDLAELEQLFRSHKYPQHKCFIRKGHGFFIIGQDVNDVAATFGALVEPFLVQQRQRCSTLVDVP